MDIMKDAKMITIVVEGTPHEWPKNSEINYTQVVALEFPDFAQHPETTYSINVNAGVKLGHVAAQNWATLGLCGTRVMCGGQSCALPI